MKIKTFLRTLLIVAVLASNVGCDQISKNIVRQNISYHEQIFLIDDYLTLTKTENTGAFLGLGDSLPEPLKLFLLTILPLLLLGFSLIFLIKKKNLSYLAVLGICFMIGGGMGNIYDRIMYGSVTDFLHIDFVIFQTGIFNMADVSIMLGTFFILLDTYVNGAKWGFVVADNQQEG